MDQKSEIGLDQYEGRRYQGLKRHLILSCISYLFLARMRQDFGGEKPGADGVPSAHSDRGADPVLVVEHFTPEEATWSGPPRRSSERSRGTPWRGSATPSGRGRGYTPWASNSPGYPGAVGTRLRAVVLGTNSRRLWRSLKSVGLASRNLTCVSELFESIDPKEVNPLAVDRENGMAMTI